jgi:cytochrome-b5 reductase
VPLVGKKAYNHDSTLYTFGLPEGKSLSLPVCACVLMRGFDAKGEVAVRPYTPTSSNEVLGSFDLLVKVYEQGVVSKWLDGLEIGAPVGFKHIPFNIKAQYPFGLRAITMLAGGTGITPMYQALQLLAKADDKTEVTLLYGNKSPEDILLKDELAALEAQSEGRIKVVHVVGTSPDQAPIEGWEGELGWVDKAKVEKYAAKPADDVAFFVCGLPVMYDVFCGPRDEKELKEGTVLHQLGYTTDMVHKF